MSITNTATPFLPHCPGPLPIVEPQASPTVVATTPAALEFARLEAWLASSHTLQLPLHQIESQQQTKGREVAQEGDQSPRWSSGGPAEEMASGIIANPPL